MSDLTVWPEASDSITCPMCQSKAVGFHRLPASKLIYEANGEETTEHMPPMKSCACDNCGADFLILDEA